MPLIVVRSVSARLSPVIPLPTVCVDIAAGSGVGRRTLARRFREHREQDARDAAKCGAGIVSTSANRCRIIGGP